MWRLGEVLAKDTVCQNLFSLYNECLTKEALEGFGVYRNGEEVIHTVKYLDDLVLLAKEETVLQGMTYLLKLEDAMEWK